MSAVALFSDNDVIIKLAKMDAYADALTALNLRPAQIGSLAVMLRYMGKASESNRMKFMKDRSSADRLSKILVTITEVEPTKEERALAAKLMKIALTLSLDIDEGELALISVALLRGNSDVATGDKRALRTLPELVKHEGAIAKMRGRFICFEQLIKALCQSFGLPRVREAVTSDRAADGTITQAYDFFASSPMSQFVAAMDHVVGEHIHIPAPGWLKSF